MPNWCSVEIKIDGDMKQVVPLVSGNDSNGEHKDVTFNVLIPMPEDIYRGSLGTEERKIYGKNNWYDWSCSNWGTKWDAVDGVIRDNTIMFDTAWNDPYEWLLVFAEKLGELNISAQVNCFTEGMSVEDGLSGYFIDEGTLYDDEADEEFTKAYMEMYEEEDEE